MGYVDTEGALLEQINVLRKEVERQKAIIDELEMRYRESLISEADANRRIRELEKTLTTLRTKIQEMEIKPLSSAKASPYHVPLLHIVGSWEFGEADAKALRRAQVRFKRIQGATLELIDAELRRRRLSDSLYMWVLISAHMGPEGVFLESLEEVVPPDWWNENLIGVEVVFLNGCKSLVIADNLVGLVPAVISLGDNVTDVDATAFAFAFWRRMKEGETAGHAFRAAIDDVPQVAEFADIRIN
jgi:hypothetical protein